MNADEMWDRCFAISTVIHDCMELEKVLVAHGVFQDVLTFEQYMALPYSEMVKARGYMQEIVKIIKSSS